MCDVDDCENIFNAGRVIARLLGIPLEWEL